MKKTCSKCKQEKKITEFSLNKKCKGGRTTVCKNCVSNYMKGYKGKRTKEENATRFREYYSRNKLKERERKLSWVYSQQKKESDRQYRRNNPEKMMLKTQRRRAMLKNAPGDGVTTEQWKQIIKQYGYRCFYCKKENKLTVDHVVPLSRGGAHDVSNVVPACINCNSKKGSHAV